MPRSKLLTDAIQEQEITLLKYKAILESFPDAKIHQAADGNITFSSKRVNQTYNQLKFDVRYQALRVVPSFDFEFIHNNTITLVPIYSSPKYNRLAYLRIDWKTRDRLIKFSRLAINIKNNHFNEAMLNECRVHIMNFIKSNPTYKLDEKHLDPKLKKLLLFT